MYVCMYVGRHVGRDGREECGWVGSQAFRQAGRQSGRHVCR